MNQIILFENGEWEWKDLAATMIENTSQRHVVLTIGENWHDSEVSKMVSDYYHSETLSWIFNQE